MSETTVELLLQFIIYLGAGIAGAFAVFQFLAKRWIENKFSQRLEAFKHKQDVEINRLRIEIDSTLSGILKIQEKEFETLPEAWSNLDEAYSYVADLVSPLQHYPNVDGMAGDRLIEFLDETNLRRTEKERVLQSDEKSNTYQKIIFWHRLHQVKLACHKLDKYVVRYGIFFPPNIKELFNTIVSDLNRAVFDNAVGHEENDIELKHEAWLRIKDSIEPLFQKIETEVHVRLQSHGRNQ